MTRAMTWGQILEIDRIYERIAKDLPKYRDRVRARYINRTILPELRGIMDQMQAAIRDYFDDAATRFLGQMSITRPPLPAPKPLTEAEFEPAPPMGEWFDLIWDDEEEKAKIEKVLEPHVRRGMDAGAKKGQILLGIELGLDIHSPLSENWLKEHTIQFADRAARGITVTTEKRIKRALTQGWREGDDFHKLTTRVQSVFDEGRRFRAERIARKETIQANNISAMGSYKQVGLEQSELVGCTPGCPECDAAIAQCPCSIERGMEIEAGLHPNHIGSWVPVVPDDWTPPEELVSVEDIG